MSELAFNMNGEPFEVPADATEWRVRRMQDKGAPKVVYGHDGLPLMLPIDATIDDLRDAVDGPGRFRVDPVIDHRPIPSAPAGYVFVHDGDAPVAVTKASLPPASDSIVIEAMRMNAEIAKSVVDRFPQMLEAAALLLRAADGAGLPARQPVVVDEDDDVTTESELKSPGFDLNGLVAQLMPLIVAGFTSGKIKTPDLASVIDWRKAAKKKPVKATPTAASASEPPHVAAIDPAAMGHLVVVQAALEPHEVAFVQEAAKELGPDELRSWIDELGQLSVPDAVARIRELIAGKNGGAS